MKNIYRPLVLTLVCLAGSGCERTGTRSAEEHVERALTAQDRGNHAAAIIELKNALQLDPKHPRARLQLGRAYARAGLGAEAEKELLVAQNLGIDKTETLPARGRAYLSQRKFQNLLNEIQPLSAMSAVSVAEVFELRGHANLGLGKYADGCALFERARSADPSYAPAYWGLAKCAAVQRDISGARAHLTEALRTNPASSEGWALLGELERFARRTAEGETAFGKAIALSPSNIAAHLGRAALRIDARNLDGAQQDIDHLIEQHTRLAAPHHMRGVLLYHRGKYKEAVTAFEAALARAPDYHASTFWLALAHAAQSNYGQAQTHLDTFVRAYPNAVDAKALLAFVRARQGDRDAAASLAALRNVDFSDPASLLNLGRAYVLVGEAGIGAAYLAKAVAKDETSMEARLTYGSALLHGGKVDAAVEQLLKARELDPSSSKAEALLIQGLVRRKQFDQALQAAQRFVQLEPQQPLPLVLRGGVQLLKGDKARAREDFAAALKLKDSDINALQGMAVLALDERKHDEAKDYYEQILRVDGKHLRALLSLYALELEAQRAPAATQLLERAQRAHPTHPLPALVLARQQLLAGASDQAIATTEAAARAHPNDAMLLGLRGEAFLQKGDAPRALTEFKRLAAQLPKSADAHYALAAAFYASDNFPSTRQSLYRTLQLEPRHLRAKILLAQLEIRSGNAAAAGELASELKAAKQPIGWLLQAEAAAKSGNVAKAIDTLQAARQQFPEHLDVTLSLARVHWLANDSVASLAVLRDWQQKHPQDARSYALAGQLFAAAGKDAEAAQQFETALRLQPNDPATMNNLAWVLRNANPKRAFELVRQADQANPNNAAILDTFAWLQLAQGDSVGAVERLRRARSLAPNNPQVRYHYARALAKAGNGGEAIRELKELLASGRKFPGIDEARVLLTSLE